MSNRLVLPTEISRLINFFRTGPLPYLGVRIHPLKSVCLELINYIFKYVYNVKYYQLFAVIYFLTVFTNMYESTTFLNIGSNILGSPKVFSLFLL